jgi:O-antigen ligase/VanZ family protein
LRLRRNFSIATAIMIAVIVYGSLYPFMFRQPAGLGPAARALFNSWAEAPGRGDFIANIALYTPFGFFAILAISGIGSATKRILMAVAAGAILSTCMELAQYYDDSRQTAATDLYANVVGTLLGAIGGGLTGGRFRWPLLREIAPNRVPTLLLSAWAGYRLYPYVPTIDLHKYWNAIKPVVLHPSLTGYDLFRYTAIWLTIGVLVEAIGGQKRVWLMFPFFVGSVIVAKVMIVDTTLTMAEVAGAGLAFCVWGILAVRTRLRVTLIALVFCCYVIAERLEPFEFLASGRAFSWIPFLGLMSGSIEIGVLSFLQKFFLFGSSIWLLTRAGLRLRSSTFVVVVILFITSQAQTYLPDRTAEITDAVMAVLIGAMFALIEGETRRNRDSVPARRRSSQVAVLGPGPASERIVETRSAAEVRIAVDEHASAPRDSGGLISDGTSRTDRATTLMGLVVAAVCLASALAIAANHPLARWVLGVALGLFALALWRWPTLWLAFIPAALPALDLTPWTGWMYLGESDPFVLVTIGILVLRAPPRRADFVVGGFPGIVLALALVSCLLSIALGLALLGPEGGSDNPYLRPDNALRLAKGFFVALALLPFLRQSMRTRGDAMAWLGAGMMAGLALVAAATLAERAVFTGLFDFSTGYRVVGTFSSMHMGGGHIGAYIAMALPFLLVCLLRPRPLTLLAMFGVAICAGYALVVSFARAAYAAALVATFAASLGWAWAARRGDRGTVRSAVLAALPLLLVGVIVIAALDTRVMTKRLQTLAPDLIYRESNWIGGLGLRDDSLFTALFGMGLGSYPRVVLARKPDGRFPTNFVVEHDGAYPFLSLHAGLPVYLGQKLSIETGWQYRLFVSLRSPDGKGALSISVCEKLLLYSASCRDATFRPRSRGIWEDFGGVISGAGLGGDVVLGWLKRPVELALFDPVPDSTIEIGHIRLFDPRDRDILANGDFSHGMDRWYFTDDQHRIWRIHNQYLMSLFEGGVLGLVSFILLAGTAIAGAVRAMARGNRMAAAVAASLLAFLCSCVFDYLLEAPRLSVLFYIVVFTGLTMMTQHEPVSAMSTRRVAAGQPPQRTD